MSGSSARIPLQRVWPSNRVTASPHRAVLHPTEEVSRPDTLGPPRLTLHSGMVGAKAFVAKLPAPVPRPRVLRPKLRACDARCRGGVLRSTETALHWPGRYRGDIGETK
jgi:hypothetical protein